MNFRLNWVAVNHIFRKLLRSKQQRHVMKQPLVTRVIYRYDLVAKVIRVTQHGYGTTRTR